MLKPRTYYRPGLLILLLLVLKSGVAQTHFNLATTRVGGGAGEEILVTDGSYLVATRNSSDFTQLDFGRFDLQGKLIDSSFYQFNSINTIQTCGKCLKKNNHSLYTSFTSFVRSDSGYVTFIKLDSDLDSVKSKRYFEYQGYIPKTYAMQFDTDSTFILAGYVFRQIPNVYKYDLWVAKLDTNFNFLWQQRIEDGQDSLLGGFRPNSLIIDAHSSVIVSGRVQNENALTGKQYQRSFAARLNSSTGSVNWVKTFSGPDGSLDMHLVERKDGTYQFVQSQIVDRFPNSTTITKGRLRTGRIDTSGQVLSSTIFSRRKQIIDIQGFYATQDGKFYTNGQHIVLPDKYGSVGFKFSGSGDSLWSRAYFYGDSQDVSNVWNFAPTPDSGFVHVGSWLDIYNTQSFLAHTWLLKTDKDGCEVEGCMDLGVEKSVVPTERLSIYPNPATNEINITWDGETPQKIRVYDNSGRVVLSQAYQDRIVLSGLSPGQYIIEVQLANQVYREKLTISRQ